MPEGHYQTQSERPIQSNDLPLYIYWIQTNGHLFRGRYKAILVEEADYLRNVIRYIHLNPVKARMVRSPDKWAYSSHKELLKSFVVGTPAFTSLRQVRNFFSNSKETYVEFMRQGIDAITEEFYSRKTLKPIFGSAECSQVIKEKVGLLEDEIDVHKE